MSPARPPRGGLVYSTSHGQMCPDCRRPAAACDCRHRQAPVGDGKVRVRLDTKGRKGKGVTVISGVPLPPDQLAALGGELKRRCGSGGTVKGGIIEVQGDHRDRVVEALSGKGWSIRRL